MKQTIRLFALDFYEVIVDSAFVLINYHLITLILCCKKKSREFRLDAHFPRFYFWPRFDDLIRVV